MFCMVIASYSVPLLHIYGLQRLNFSCTNKTFYFLVFFEMHIIRRQMSLMADLWRYW